MVICATGWPNPPPSQTETVDSRIRPNTPIGLVSRKTAMIASVLPTYNRAALSFVSGEGSWLETADGSRYLDMGAGIAVNALGHANPDLVAALTAQAQKLWHVSNLYQIEQ